MPIEEAYFVTFSAMDGDVGGNPLWHACFILSTMTSRDKPIEVSDVYGFYGSTPSSIQWPLLSNIKKGLGIDTDFWGGYGTLKQEEVRYLDKGLGLHGKTFHVTKEQYFKLKAVCEETIRIETQAVEEAIERLGLNKKGKLNYAAIFESEKQYAKRIGALPRLHPFQFLPSLRTCMSRATEIMIEAGIPHKALIQLSEGAIPRVTSVPLFRFPLHSQGPLHEFVSKRTNKRTLYRKWDPKVFKPAKPKKVLPEPTKLLWTLPPQNIVPLPSQLRASLKLKHYFNIPQKMQDEVIGLLSALEQFEWILINMTVAPQTKAALIKTIRQFYQEFATPSRNEDYTALDMRTDELFWFLEAMYRAAIGNGEYIYQIKDKMHQGLLNFSQSDVKAICHALGRSEPSFIESFFSM